MFGRYAISKAPISGQGSNAYFLSLTEDAALANAESDNFSYPTSITEHLTSEDTNAEHSVYYFGNVDSVFTSQDVSDIDVNYPVSVSDGVTCDETVGISAQFAGTVDEAVASLETFTGGIVVLFTITEDSGITDDAIFNKNTAVDITENLTSSNTQTITAQFAVSRSEAQAIAVHLETFGWIKIIDTQTPNWVPVDDEQ